MKALRFTPNRIHVATVLCGGFFSTAVFAAPITGILNIVGSLYVTPIKVEFLPAAGGIGSAVADTFGSTETVAALNTETSGSPTPGVIRDLSGKPQTSSASIVSFLSGFTLAPDIELDLHFIKQPREGSGVMCTSEQAVATSGNNCAPAAPSLNGSDLQSGNQISAPVSLALAGVAINILTGARSGVLSSGIDRTSYESIVAALTNDGSVPTAFSGLLTGSTIPDAGVDGAAVLVGLAALAIGLFSFAWYASSYLSLEKHSRRHPDHIR